MVNYIPHVLRVWAIIVSWCVVTWPPCRTERSLRVWGFVCGSGLVLGACAYLAVAFLSSPSRTEPEFLMRCWDSAY